MAVQDLKLFQKTEDFLNKIYPRLINFPKAEKYALCQEIKQTNYRLLAAIAQANFIRSDRLRHLEEAEAQLHVLKVLVRLSRNRGYISKGSFRDLDMDLTEISKMLSGYIKYAMR